MAAVSYSLEDPYAGLVPQVEHKSVKRSRVYESLHAGKSMSPSEESIINIASAWRLVLSGCERLFIAIEVMSAATVMDKCKAVVIKNDTQGEALKEAIYNSQHEVLEALSSSNVDEITGFIAFSRLCSVENNSDEILITNHFRIAAERLRPSIIPR